MAALPLVAGADRSPAWRTMNVAGRFSITVVPQYRLLRDLRRAGRDESSDIEIAAARGEAKRRLAVEPDGWRWCCRGFHRQGGH